MLSCFVPADNLTVSEQLTGSHSAGVNSILPKEHGSQFFYLPIIKHSDDEVQHNHKLSCTHTQVPVICLSANFYCNTVECGLERNPMPV